MSLPPGFIDELRGRLTISDVIGRRVKLTRAGREWKACCPFHKEKSPSFTVNDQKGFFHCFGCGAHGDVIGFTMRQENRSFMDAVELLAGMAGMQVPKASPEDHARFEQEKSIHALIEDAARWFEDQLFAATGRQALSYIQNRKLSDETISRFRLGFAPNDGQALIKFLGGKGYKPEQMVEAGLAKKAENEDRYYSFFRGRVIFPVGDRRGRVVAFGARLLDGDGPKYINSADHSLFHKGQLLYGFSRARAAAGDGKPIIITEGYMDVIRLVEAGFTGAVAPLGTALTEDQMMLVWKIIPRPPVRPDLMNHIPILCFDGDAAGQRAAERALDRILPHIGADQSARFAMMSGGDDPDSLIANKGPSAMQAVLDAALPLIDFMWQVTAAGRPLSTPEDRAGFRRALDVRAGLIKEKTLQQDYRDAIQKKWQENFGREPYRGSSGGNGERTGSFYPKGRMTMPLIRPRPLPDNQERIALALILNHPMLFGEMEDALRVLPLNDPRLAPLWQDVFDFMGDEEAAHESREALKDYIEKNGHGAVLSEVLSAATYAHAAYVKPQASAESARLGWHELWYFHMRQQHLDEIKNRSFEYKNTKDPKIIEEIEQLKAMLVELDSRAEIERMQA